ncbi:MAG: iron-sulfur cluster assembly protein [Proteobacteria bacterium]|nr:iron-sulfur cluster assembly protein [Pseudomonadota bacterium]
MTEKKLEDFLPNKNGIYFKEFEFDKVVKLITKKDIIKCIKTVMDPEIPVNLYDLGLIYSINNTNNNIVIEMTLTNPNCPVAGQMPESVAKSIEQINGLRSIEVKLVWKPTWSKDLMSEDAKLALDIF